MNHKEQATGNVKRLAKSLTNPKTSKSRTITLDISYKKKIRYIKGYFQKHEDSLRFISVEPTEEELASWFDCGHMGECECIHLSIKIPV